MKIILELDYELMKKYAEFLGYENTKESSLSLDKDFRNRLVEDIEQVVDMALHP